MPKSDFSAWGAAFKRRTIYVAPSVFQRIQDQATAADIAISEQVRRLLAQGIPPGSDLPGPHTELLWVYLPPALDRRVRSLAHRHGWSLASTLRRLLGAALAERGIRR